jgi:hypothetical protein
MGWCDQSGADNEIERRIVAQMVEMFAVELPALCST